MNSKILKIALFSLACSVSTVQANDDFGLWTELGVTKVLPHNFSINGGFEFRTQNNTRNVDRWSGSIGAEYKPFKFLKMGIGYTFIYEYHMSSDKPHFRSDEDDDGNEIETNIWNGNNVTSHYWTPQNRFTGEFTLDHKFFGCIKVSLRERYQYTHADSQSVDRTKYRYKTDNDGTLKRDDFGNPKLKAGYPLNDINVKESENSQYLRSRLKVEFVKKGWDVTPFVSYEIYNDLTNGFEFNKTRLMVGAEYSLNRRNEFSLAYGLGSNVAQHPFERKHILSIAYNYKF